MHKPQTLRTIVKEELHTLRLLASMKDIRQVLLDVAGGACVVFRFWISIDLPRLVHQGDDRERGSGELKEFVNRVPKSSVSTSAGSDRYLRPAPTILS